MILSLFALSVAHAIDCEKPSTLLDFQHAATRGETAFAGMDIEGLVAARDLAASHLECVQEPVTPEVAAAFHRLMAIVAFTEQDLDAVLAEFHAARRLQPGYQIPEEVAPQGHPLIRLYEDSVSAAEGDLSPVNPPVGGWVSVDGVRGAPVPTGISTIVQAFESDQTLVETVWYLPGEELPSWGPDPALASAGTSQGLGRGLKLGATGASLLAGGVMMYGAWRSNCQFWYTDSGFVSDYEDRCSRFSGSFEPIADDGESLKKQKNQTNALYFSSIGAGVLGVGLGIVTVIQW